MKTDRRIDSFLAKPAASDHSTGHFTPRITTVSFGILFLLGCSTSTDKPESPKPGKMTTIKANRPSDEEFFKMVQARVDISQPVELSFSLSFRTEEDAKAAASDIGATFTTDVGRAGLSVDSGWTVSASQTTTV